MGKEKAMQLKKEKSYFSYIMVPVLFAAVIVLNKTGILNPYWDQILQLACINGIVAMSLNLVNGKTGQVSLGQAGFMSLGAYGVCSLSPEKPKVSTEFRSSVIFLLFLLY